VFPLPCLVLRGRMEVHLIKIIGHSSWPIFIGASTLQDKQLNSPLKVSQHGHQTILVGLNGPTSSTVPNFIKQMFVVHGLEVFDVELLGAHFSERTPARLQTHQQIVFKTQGRVSYTHRIS